MKTSLAVAWVYVLGTAHVTIGIGIIESVARRGAPTLLAPLLGAVYLVLVIAHAVTEQRSNAPYLDWATSANGLARARAFPVSFLLHGYGFPLMTLALVYALICSSREGVWEKSKTLIPPPSSAKNVPSESGVPQWDGIGREKADGVISATTLVVRVHLKHAFLFLFGVFRSTPIWLIPLALGVALFLFSPRKEKSK